VVAALVTHAVVVDVATILFGAKLVTGVAISRRRGLGRRGLGRRGLRRRGLRRSVSAVQYKVIRALCAFKRSREQHLLATVIVTAQPDVRAYDAVPMAVTVFNDDFFDGFARIVLERQRRVRVIEFCVAKS